MERGEEDFAARCRRAATRIRIAKSDRGNIYRRIQNELAEEVEALLLAAAEQANDTFDIPRLNL